MPYYINNRFASIIVHTIFNIQDHNFLRSQNIRFRVKLYIESYNNRRSRHIYFSLYCRINVHGDIRVIYNSHISPREFITYSSNKSFDLWDYISRSNYPKYRSSLSLIQKHIVKECIDMFVEDKLDGIYEYYNTEYLIKSLFIQPISNIIRDYIIDTNNNIIRYML